MTRLDKATLDLTLRIRWAFETGADNTRLLREFSSLDDQVKIAAWSHMMSGPENDQPFKNYAHALVAQEVLNIFGTVVGKKGQTAKIPAWLERDVDDSGCSVPTSPTPIQDEKVP